MVTQTLNNPVLQLEFLGNTVYEWTVAVLIFIGVAIALKVFQVAIVAKLKSLAKKTKTDIDDIAINAIHAIHWPFYVLISLFIALKFVDVSDIISQWAYYIILIAVIYYAIRVVQKFIDYGAKKIMQKREAENRADTGMVKILSGIAKFTLWVVAFLLILSNLGYNINSLIAGLGIGGLAVALALQNVLGDLFSAIAIYFDQPFKDGDFIIIGTDKGIVKKIGIKTTRIQTLQGEELIISNNELTSVRVQNFGKMERRRIVFSIGVDYNTPHAKLKNIPDMIREIIERQDKTEVDRIHFKKFGDSSLNYEIVFYINAPEYPVYMDIQQSINLDIVEKFEKEKIEIAYPTTTVYVKK